VRKTIAMVIGALLSLALAGPTAQAGQPHHEGYKTRWVNVFWHSRAKIDADTYLNITWYAGAYDQGDEGFFSDLYRSVDKCRKQDGRDRCSYQRALSWYGYAIPQADNTFSVDKKLSLGRLDATYKLFRTQDKERILVGRFHIVTDLVGTGDLTRGKSSYTYHQGCTTFKYSGKYESREAAATGTLSRGNEPPRDLGETDDAAFGANESVEIDHTC
jgi:hypothetical protein